METDNNMPFESPDTIQADSPSRENRSSPCAWTGFALGAMGLLLTVYLWHNPPETIKTTQQESTRDGGGFSFGLSDLGDAWRNWRNRPAESAPQSDTDDDSATAVGEKPKTWNRVTGWVKDRLAPEGENPVVEATESEITSSPSTSSVPKPEPAPPDTPPANTQSDPLELITSAGKYFPLLASLSGASALLLGGIGWARREDRRILQAAMYSGGLAVAWHYILLAVAVAVCLAILFFILNNVVE